MSFKRGMQTAGVLLLLSMFTACVTTKFETPRLTVVSVGMTSADVFSQQFRIRLHVQNPNARELPVKSIEYELFLQGDSFAEGISNQPFVVPAMGEAEFDTVVNTHFMSSVGRLLSKLNSSDGNKVQYVFVGKVHLSKGMLRNLPFSEQGMVELGIKR
ncbi:MAG: LEA type 2 family protein [Steroidobacteraceae bacterium]